MKSIFYLLIFFQIIPLISAYANKLLVDLGDDESIKWEKIHDKKTKNNTIFWKSYNDDESYFSKEELNHNNFKYKNKFSIKENQYFTNEKVITNINSLIPLNNFLNEGGLQTIIEWKSSFDGGVSQGTGQQNPSLVIDYGFSRDSILSFYLTGADDLLYNHINGSAIPYYWQSYALSYQSKLFESHSQKLIMSYVTTFEYWRIASGSKDTKSIFNQKDDSLGKEKFENFVGAFSLPITKELGNKFTFVFVPGITFLPEKLGSKGSINNSYGKNVYLGTGIVFNLLNNLKFLSSYTIPLGPGSNYFDESLNYSNKSIYSYGLNWDINQKIGIEGKFTNAYGSTPSTGLLTLPSDNKILYSANVIYNPYGEDTFLKPLSKRDKLISLGGLTVNNALIQDFGKSQGSLNFDNSGNIFFSYKYSLSNIFQLDFIDIGTFGDVSNPENKNIGLRKTYVDKKNLNFRLGGKLMFLSPQKNDFLWTSLRTSVGRNDNTNQGYIYSELINTIRLNEWIAINISPKYFFSGRKSFGVVGLSQYINLSDDFQIIPEMNTLLNKESEFNTTVSLRYLFKSSRSIDLYYSNATGIQDLGQNLRGEDKFGIKLNFSY